MSLASRTADLATRVATEFKTLRSELAGKVSKSSSSINVKDYGAVGNGTSDDTTALNNAIAAAVAGSSDLYWPPGTYVASANLASFWSVSHRGPGRISSSGNVYAIEPWTSEQNTIWASQYGSNANDGLSPERPVANLSMVDAIIQRLGASMNRGKWRFRLSGTFNGGYTFERMPRSANAIIFEGDALVGGNPVTTINYQSGGNIFGMCFEPGGWVQLKNLKFANFRVGFNGYAALTKGGGSMYVTDCWADNCDCGFSAINQAVLTLARSRVTNSTTGVRVQYGSTGTIGGTAGGTTIQGCETGMVVSRYAVVHLDYSTITDSTVTGVLVDMASRMVMIQGTVHRNAIGVTVQGAGEWSHDPQTDWGDGTANANTINWRHRGAGRENRLHSQDTHLEWRMFVSDSSVSTSAGTNTNLIALPSGYAFMPGHFTQRKEQKLRAEVKGTLVGAASKSIALYKTDPAGANLKPLSTVSTAQAGDFNLTIEVWPISSTEQQYRCTLIIEGVTPVITTGTTTAPTDHEWRFRLYSNSGSVSSTVTVDMFELYITG